MTFDMWSFTPSRYRSRGLNGLIPSIHSKSIKSSGLSADSSKLHRWLPFSRWFDRVIVMLLWLTQTHPHFIQIFTPKFESPMLGRCMPVQVLVLWQEGCLAWSIFVTNCQWNDISLPRTLEYRNYKITTKNIPRLLQQVPCISKRISA